MDRDRHERQELGKLGEDIACRFLEDKGHTIIERNFRSGHLEIDIITYAPDGMHFVEVKTRRSGIQAPPQDNVNAEKQRKIARAAARFFRSGRGIPFTDCECLFDIVAVTFEEDSARTEWFPQAYIPLYI